MTCIQPSPRQTDAQPSTTIGKRSERLAAEYLKRTGYRIIETNFRSKVGEIDIIAKEKGTIVFVEVKARSSSRFGSPKGAVTPAKQRKISMAALDYLKQSGADRCQRPF